MNKSFLRLERAARALLALLLAAALAVGIGPPAARAAFPDAAGHWAEGAITRWTDQGLLQGYPDGGFGPGDAIVRGDVAVILSRLFGYLHQAENTFSDIAGDEYFADAVLRAKAAGAMQGSADGFYPRDSLSRQEAAVLFCNLLGIEEAGQCTLAFEDDGQIASWARGSVYALTNRGLMSGYNGHISPEAPISRAEFVTLLDNAIARVAEGPVFEQNIYGTVLVTDGGLTLRNMRIVGDLIVAEGVGEGGLRLENVTVSGAVRIRGGARSIALHGACQIGRLVAEKQNGALYIRASEDSYIGSLTVMGGAQLGLTANVGTLTVLTDAPIFLSGASVKQLDIVADGAVVTVEGSAYVAAATLSGDGVQLVGVGVVASATVGGRDAVILTSRTGVTVLDGVTGTMVADRAVAAGARYEAPDNTETFNEEYTYTGVIYIDRDIVLELPSEPEEPDDPGLPAVPKEIEVYFTVEAFTIGHSSYIVEPTAVTVDEGTLVAAALLDLLDDAGFAGEYAGEPAAGSFYLRSMDGIGYLPADDSQIVLPDCLEAMRAGILFSGSTVKPITPSKLSEFDYTNMSGWMYSVNHIFPNVSMGAYPLSDGDVVRLQFTLWGYGADIGGGYAAGGLANYYEVPDMTQSIREALENGSLSSAERAVLLSIARKVSK